MNQKFIQTVFDKLRQTPQRIVFPEGRDPRIVEAAVQYQKLGLGQALLLGTRAESSPVETIDPEKSDKIDGFIQKLTSLQRYKEISEPEARKIVTQPGYFGSFLLQEGEVSGLVGGATSYSSGMLRPLLQLIKPAGVSKTISSCMALQLPDLSFGQEGVLFCADCSVIPRPTAEQLAFIALESCKLMSMVPGLEPRAAMLSYSTKGSAVTEDTEKVVRATELAQLQLKEDGLPWAIEGELQADAALVAGIAKTKTAQSAVAGRANILVFPDLNSGNIAVKLIHRLTRAQAYGNILLGLSKPAADLSRGASVEEIVGVAAIVGLQSAQHNNSSHSL
jgi:phosphate acetyltransferase